jgi:hypothetical protein
MRLGNGLHQIDEARGVRRIIEAQLHLQKGPLSSNAAGEQTREHEHREQLHAPPS